VNEERLRLDKWLWAARLFKTRALAVQACERGRVLVNQVEAKAGRELKAGDRLRLRIALEWRELEVRSLSRQRGPAAQAQALYAETPESLAARQRVAEQRRLAAEPAHAREQGRPTKRERRQLVSWQRWSASMDDRQEREDP
jgi:ribosome-associated heat shock protein Hsp15